MGKKVLVIGSLNMDFVVRVEDMPAKGETILGRDLRLVPGGKGGNQAYACARLGLSTAILGAVGKDANGEALLASLCGAGVDVSRVERLEGACTGLAVIMVDKAGENSITVIQGANALVTREMIDRNRPLMKESDIVVLQLEIPLDTVTYAARTAKEYGKIVILDPAPAPENLPRELLLSVDVIKPNETELSRLSKIAVDEKNLSQAADKLRAMGVQNVVVTLGAQGAYVLARHGMPERVMSPVVEAADTTAAGDAFTAGLAAMLAEGASLAEAARFAARVGAVTVTRRGAQSSIPTREEVDRAF